MGVRANWRAPLATQARRLVPGLAVITGLILAITGCASPTAESSQIGSTISVPSADSTLAEQVPDSIRADGQLLIATDPTYPPLEMIRDGHLEGFDIDLIIAVAGLLGLEPEIRQTAFSNVIPSVVVNEHEVGISALWSDAPNSIYVDMVTYLEAGVELAAQRGPGTPKPTEFGLCGHSVSVVEGTTYIDTLVSLSQACRKQDKRPIEINASLDQDGATSLLRQGLVDAMLADGPVVEFAVSESNGQLVRVGKPINVRPYAIAVNQGLSSFAELVRDAVQELIDTGVYGQLLDAWGLQTGGIAESKVLPATTTPPIS